jgi:hypothetical protein
MKIFPLYTDFVVVVADFNVFNSGVGFSSFLQAEKRLIAKRKAVVYFIIFILDFSVISFVINSIGCAWLTQ